MTLTVENLLVTYAETTAVENVTFEIESGEVVGLVGESGAGKSTLALALVGLAGERSGSIRFGGDELVGASSARLREVRGSKIGLAFQDADDALHPAYTVGEQVAEGIDGRRRGWQRRHEHRVESLLDAVGLDPAFSGRYPHQLSGGQKQRALLAVSLAGDPDLLIADEPTSSLDTITQADVLDTLDQLASERDLSILLISHDLGVIERTCNRTLVMRDGEIVDRGPTDTLLSDPSHPYTSELVAARTPQTTAVDGRTVPVGPVVAAANEVSKEYTNDSLLASLFGGETTTALADVSLSVHRGENVALVGRSGAGKTTLARLLAGLETPTAGTVSLYDDPVGPIRQRTQRQRAAIGYVFQSPRASLDPRRTVAESVAEPLRGAGWNAKRRHERVEELLDAVGLGGYGPRYPHELSGGEAQRVGVARALALDPVLLVLDEATSALDTVTADTLCSLFERLGSERDLSLLVVTHDFAIASRLADRTLVLEDGTVIERGPTGSLLSDPQRKQTQQLVNATLKQ